MTRLRVDAAALLLLLAPVCSAGEWAYRPLVEQDDSFVGFVGSPIINNAGDVVFVAEVFDDDGPRPDLGLFRTAGDSIEQVAFSNGLSPYRDASFAQFPLLSDSGQVAFYAVSFLHGAGMFTGPDPAVDSIVNQVADGVTGVGLFPAMNRLGDVLFQAGRPGGVSGIYSGPDPVADLLVDNSGPFLSVGTQVDLNDHGDVVFEARLPNGEAGLYSGPDPATDTLVDSTGPFAATFISPRINNRGDLTFYAELDSGVTGLFTGPDPVADLLVDDTGPFEVLGGAIVNNSGGLLFSAVFDNGRIGVFDGTDVDEDRVVGTGDPLFGSIVTEIAAYDAYNDAGQFAFRYALADGREGIAIAAPIRPGDYNRDGAVDALDYHLWRSQYGTPVAAPGDQSDGNSDGVVDAADYTVWRDALAPGVGLAAPAPPACVSVVTAAALSAFMRRRPS
ncbi:hypothetical protein KOR34_40830 [Posidoniimonas corsicana]|uniref:Dockerin domain-containing protein n=1 Tax=Posidoniimonas corsicana TaxID=1938618 RepID=A0A5C5V2V2_9BACT|nr:choice-of-anchor tandem repeat NxxGxxAF-containing protein [Posidoniimonas corsicana]TWT32320.1 hypothetical protein KOR34_40830 [Posidoniimonas corsicana]